jgi:hypothetical protein
MVADRVFAICVCGCVVRRCILHAVFLQVFCVLAVSTKRKMNLLYLQRMRFLRVTCIPCAGCMVTLSCRYSPCLGCFEWPLDLWHVPWAMAGGLATA